MDLFRNHVTNKNGGDMWGLCTEILWKSYHFVTNDTKKPKDISGEAYIQSSDANMRVLLNHRYNTWNWIGN